MNLKTHYILLIGYSKQMNLQTDSQSDEDGFEDGNGFVMVLKMTSKLIQNTNGWRVLKWDR